MALTATINDFISQIRFRVRQREEAFRRKINGFYGDAGVTGQTGRLVQRSIDALSADFDEATNELLTYLVRSERRLSLDRGDLYSAVAQELMQSAIAFKAALDVERLTRFAKVGRVREIVHEAFSRLDEQLAVRLREYLVGLREDASQGADARSLTLTDQRDRFLAALLLNIADRADNVFVPVDVAQRYALPLNPGQLRLIVRELELEELIEPVIDPNSSSPRPNQEAERYVLSWSGVSEAEKISGQSDAGSRPAPSKVVPASNRYVSLDDNAQSAIKSDLSTLREAIRGDNEIEEEARLIALSEIAVFEQTIIQPRISTELIERFLAGTLAWLSDAFAKAAVGEVIKRLVSALTKAIAS